MLQGNQPFGCYADDICLLAHTNSDMTEILSLTYTTARGIALHINIVKLRYFV